MGISNKLLQGLIVLELNNDNMLKSEAVQPYRKRKHCLRFRTKIKCGLCEHQLLNEYDANANPKLSPFGLVKTVLGHGPNEGGPKHWSLSCVCDSGRGELSRGPNVSQDHGRSQ